MHNSVRAFLDQIIDYAGLFPPAKLPLEDAVERYCDERCKSHDWMLRGFVCPTGRLRDLLTWTQSQADPFAVAALGQQSAQASEFLTQVKADMRAIAEYRREWLAARPDGYIETETAYTAEYIVPGRSRAGVFTYEVALPKGLTLAPPMFDRFAEQLQRLQLDGFLEIPVTPTWRTDVENACQCIEAWRRQEHSYDFDRYKVGLKLRCGGPTADAFPADAEVAFFIDCCRKFRILWKATAGMHHPNRHREDELKLWHHGFLNVFAAGVLAWNHALSEAELLEILADHELRDLRFEPDRMIWKRWECSTAQIAEARTRFATSFGSCSFEEPCADLTAMGLLDSAIR